jgi:hypothetical protein
MQRRGGNNQRRFFLRNLIRGRGQREAQKLWCDKPLPECSNRNREAQLCCSCRRFHNTKGEATRRTLFHAGVQFSSTVHRERSGQRHSRLSCATAEHELARLDNQHAHAELGRRSGRGEHLPDVSAGPTVQLSPDRIRELRR